MTQPSQSPDPQLTELILECFPTPLAIAYQRLLQAENWHDKFYRALALFDYGIRSLTLIYVRQYLLQDSARGFDHPALNLALSKFNQPTLGAWLEILYTAIGAYKEQPERQPFPELHDSFEDQKQGKEFRRACQEIIEIRNDVVHRFVPDSEEEWQEKAGKLIDNLQIILSFFKFIQNYSVVDVTEIQPSGAIGVEYRGVRPRPVSLPPESTSLQVDRLYVWTRTKLKNQYHDLHPLMISWPPARESQDAAIYESLTNTRISYLATLLRDTVGLTERPAIEQLIAALDKIRIRRKERRHSAGRITWELWKEITTDITQVETETIRVKYDPRVYLQRRAAKAMVGDFLASDSSALLVLGKSGVGKSNFLLSVLEDYSHEQDTAVLMLDAARLPVQAQLDITLTKMIREVANLPDDLIDALEKDLWGVLSKTAENKRFILIFDAINENDQARELLSQIDRLIGGMKRPWLKIIISSRPQAWQIIQRGLHLAEQRYFRAVQKAEIGFELEGFTLNEQGAELKDFTKDELPEVYAKYREVWHLQTEYADLPPELKRRLRDPLTLKLIAEIYENQSIPSHVDPSELYAKYVERLVKDHRLEAQDILLLEQDLMPLLIGENHFSNEITADQVAETTLARGRPLRDLIFDTTQLDVNSRINSSFTRLTDTEILVKQGGDLDFTIRFKYERFYDYYAGKRLRVVAKMAGQAVSQSYLGFIDSLGTYPFIWGAIQQALIQEALNEKYALLIELAGDPKQIVKDILYNVVVELSRSDTAKADAITWLMYQSKSLALQKLAVLIAGSTAKTDILKETGKSRFAELRVQSIQSTYYLWQSEPERGWEVLNDWSKSVLGRYGLPNVDLLQSILSITMLIITDARNTLSADKTDFRNPKILAPLQSLWKNILSQLLFINKEGNITNITRLIWGNLTLSAVIKFGLGVTTGASIITTRQRGSVIPLIKQFFRKSSTERQILNRLIDEYYKPANGLAPVEDLLYLSLKDDEPLPLMLALSLILMRSNRQDIAQDISVVERLFLRVFDPAAPGMSAAQLVFASQGLMQRSENEISETTWDKFTSIQRKYLDAGGLYYLPNQPKYEAGYIDGYTLVALRKLGRTYPNLFREYIIRAMEGKPAPSMAGLLGEADSLAIVGKQPQLALVALQPLLAIHDEAIEDILCKVLARIRLYHPDLVDNYLWENKASARLSMKVQTTVVAENLWADFLISRVGNFLSELLFIPEFKDMFLSSFRYAITAKSFEEWLIKVLKRLINFIYGEAIL